jgi:hypothetical protein
MWRSVLLTAAVLLCAQAARAQAPAPRPGPAPQPAPIFPDPAVLRGLPGIPNVTPSAPYVQQPGTAGAPGASLPPVPAPFSPGESLTAFDPTRVELKSTNGRWQLVAGDTVLKDVGPNELEAREVFRVVREMRLTALGTLGQPRPVMEYWLVNGEAPRAAAAGLRTLLIDQASLRAEAIQGQWCLHDRNRVLFNFGPQADAARQALAVVQRHGFTHVGFVGRSAPVMLVFLASPGSVTPAAARAFDPRAARPFGSPPPAQPGQLPPVATQPLAPAPFKGPEPIAPASFSPHRQPGTLGAPQGNMLAPANRVPIDPRQVQPRRENGDWKLTMNEHVLASFGPNVADAQLAQAALRHYGCSDQVTLGGSSPAFSYYLANGQAPRGLMHGLNATPIRIDALSVRQVGPSYVLSDGSQTLMSFGDRMADAHQALRAIQQHRFDHVCRIGPPDKGLTLLVRAN